MGIIGLEFLKLLINLKCNIYSQKQTEPLLMIRSQVYALYRALTKEDEKLSREQI